MPFWPDPLVAAWTAVALAAPLLIWAALSDLKRMIIPNGVSIGLIVGFVVWAVLFLPPEDALWRAGAGVVTLILGLGLVILARMGGGDMKLLAAVAPFIAPDRAGLAMVLLAVCLIVLLPPLLVIRRMRRGRDTNWAAFDPAARDVPMGVSIAVATLLFLVLIALGG